MSKTLTRGGSLRTLNEPKAVKTKTINSCKRLSRINNWAVVTVGVFHAQTLNHHLWSDVLSFRNLKYSSAFDIILLLRENFKSKIQKIWNERERKKADNGTQLFLVDRINDNIITEVRSVYSVGSRAEFFWKFLAVFTSSKHC